MGTVCTIKIYNQKKSYALDDGFNRIKKLADEITVNQKGMKLDLGGIAKGYITDQVKKVYITSGLKNKFKLFKDSGYRIAKLN